MPNIPYFSLFVRCVVATQSITVVAMTPHYRPLQAWQPPAADAAARQPPARLPQRDGIGDPASRPLRPPARRTAPGPPSGCAGRWWQAADRRAPIAETGASARDRKSVV